MTVLRRQSREIGNSGASATAFPTGATKFAKTLLMKSLENG